MEFAFATTELRSLCESRRKAKAALGDQAARALEQCLADLEANETVGDFLVLFEDEVCVRSPSELALRFDVGYEIVFCAGHVKVPVTPSGATDWSKVTRIKFTMLEVVHG